MCGMHAFLHTPQRHALVTAGTAFASESERSADAVKQAWRSRLHSQARLRECAAAGGARRLRLGAVHVREHGAAAEGGQVRVVRRRAHAHRARAAAEQVAQVVPAHARAPGLSNAHAAAAWGHSLYLCAQTWHCLAIYVQRQSTQQGHTCACAFHRLGVCTCAGMASTHSQSGST